MLKQMLLQNWLEVVIAAWVLTFLSLMHLAWTAPNSFINLVLGVFGMVLSTVVAMAQNFYENLELK